MEHIIPRALGGRRQVRGFICRRCNLDTGARWDKVAADQLHQLSVLLGTIRQDGAPPRARFSTTAGEDLLVGADGSVDMFKPSMTKEKLPGVVNFRISGRNLKETQGFLKRIKKEMPHVNTDEAVKRISETHTHAKGMIQASAYFGGAEAMRSAVKSCLSLMSASHLNARLATTGLSYLQNAAMPACTAFHHGDDVILERPSGIPLHAVIVATTGGGAPLVGYAEYFGTFRVVISLAQNFHGPAFQTSYAINPQTGRKLNLSTKLPTPEEIDMAIRANKPAGDAAAIALEAVLRPRLEHLREQARSDAMTRATKAVMAELGVNGDTPLTPDQMQIVIARLSYAMAHHMIVVEGLRPRPQSDAGGNNL